MLITIICAWMNNYLTCVIGAYIVFQNRQRSIKTVATDGNIATMEAYLRSSKQGSLTATNYTEQLQTKTLSCGSVYIERILKAYIPSASIVICADYFVHGGANTYLSHCGTSDRRPSSLPTSQEKSKSNKKPETVTNKDKGTTYKNKRSRLSRCSRVISTQYLFQPRSPCYTVTVPSANKSAFNTIVMYVGNVFSVVGQTS